MSDAYVMSVNILHDELSHAPGSGFYIFDDFGSSSLVLFEHLVSISSVSDEYVAADEVGRLGEEHGDVAVGDAAETVTI